MARDGHEFQAWLAAPAGRPRGAVVLLQEIFGVNGHIRAVADGFRRPGLHGHRAVPVRPHTPRHRARLLAGGGAGRGRLPRPTQARDHHEGHRGGRRGGAQLRPYGHGRLLLGRHAVVPCRLPAAGQLRGGLLRQGGRAYLEQKPRCPVMYHFGARGPEHPAWPTWRRSAPPCSPPRACTSTRAPATASTATSVPSYNPQAAALARTRTLEFLGRYLAGDDAAKD